MVNKVFVVTALLFGFALFVIGILLRKGKSSGNGGYKYKAFTKDGFVERINYSENARSFSNLFHNSDKVEKLFRKSKNPWNLTVVSYNFIRYGLSAAALFVGMATAPFGLTYTFIFAVIAFMLFFIPKKAYEDAALSRENQWNQLYQFIWVIKHNLSYYDPKKTWLETERYIRDHTDNLPELENGFKDFADHWNDQYIDEYLQEMYCEFTIPKQLLDVVLTSQATGEYPDYELTSLRDIILEKMNFHVQEVLSTVGAKATFYSSPFLLMSMALIMLVPVALQIMYAFSAK